MDLLYIKDTHVLCVEFEIKRHLVELGPYRLRMLRNLTLSLIIHTPLKA